MLAKTPQWRLSAIPLWYGESITLMICDAIAFYLLMYLTPSFTRPCSTITHHSANEHWVAPKTYFTTKTYVRKHLLFPMCGAIIRVTEDIGLEKSPASASCRGFFVSHLPLSGSAKTWITQAGFLQLRVSTQTVLTPRRTLGFTSFRKEMYLL